jgi:hypothetical protein
MACDGTLWGVDQDRQVVMVVNSGETTSKCAAFDIPWLSEDPVSGTEFPDNGDVVDTTSTVTGDADGLTIGLHRALLLLTSDTPDDDIAIPVYFTNGFMDVPEENFAERFIHALAGAGITYGCDWGMYCPDELMTRRVMSAWILRSAFGADYNPPPATGIIFQDVAPDSLFSNYIEDFFNQGYTSGCSADPPLYCPDNPLTRAQMAVFILLGIEGPGYTPPACSGIFADVTCPSPFAPWVEELYNRGITSGCGTDPLRYCPNSETTRAQMAVFLVTGFGFPIAP